MKALLTLATYTLACSAIHLGQPSAHAGDKGGGGVAGGSTNCSTASALVLGENAFTTAPSSATLNVPEFGGCLAHTMYKVNYFTFTPATTGNYTFSTCQGTVWDSRMLLMSTCSTSSLIACNDDSCSLQSRVDGALSAGVTYRIVVGGFSGTSGGPGILTVGQGGGGGGGGGVNGPDLTISAIPDISKYGSVVQDGQTIMAYSFGMSTCNVGDEIADWFSQPDNRHPFLAQNMYRIRGGRIEQIGLGWGRHATTPLQGSVCGTCAPATGGTALGIGCSDIVTASLNGTQSALGTRSEVNVATGIFPGSYNAGMPAPATTIGRRLQVNANDLNPSFNPSAIYLMEGQCVHPGDASRDNDNNNNAYRLASVGSLSQGAYTLIPASGTSQQPAIYAWRETDVFVTIVVADVPNDGRFLLGYRVSQNPNGTWHYEYALQNLNSNRCGQSFSVPAPIGTVVTNPYFHDVEYHSGDPYVLTDWVFSSTGGRAEWAGGTYAQNPNNNALRFSTMYNFAFDASTSPVAGNATLGLFKPGGGNSVNSIAIPALVPSVPSNPADLNGDGVVNAQDLAILLGNWGGTGIGDLNGDGIVDSADIAIMLNSWTNIVPGDLNNDGIVNASDLAILLGNWGGSGAGDLNGDGTVDSADIAILLNNWT